MVQPVADVARAARDYSMRSGLALPPRRATTNAYITQPASQAIGQAYDRLPHFDAGALPAYHQMREETMRQYDHMTKPRSRGGLGIDVEVTKGDPYGTGGFNPVDNLVNELRHDVQENNRIKVLSTKSTGGHAVFSDDENDAFRAVHDVFGHLGSGRGIDMHGEEAAYQSHSQMFSPLARQAMATETRGQNAALHLHGEFQDQKIGLLPAHMQGLQFNRQGSGVDVRNALRDAQHENRKQGL